MSLARRLVLLGGLLLPAAGCGGLTPVSRVIFVTFDTTRADRIGAYGYGQAATPNLDRLADQSVLFEQAVSPVPTTLPSHATMFTGQYPQDHGVRYNLFYRLPPEALTLAEMLHEGGFATAGFPASQIVGRVFGLDQGFDVYDAPEGPGQKDTDHPVANIMRTAGEGVDLALDWLAGHPTERVFVWLHLYDPHWTYEAPFPFASQFRERPYDGEIAYADSQFGRLLDALKSGPHWKETLLIVAGDHGEGLYEHRERWHTMLIYESTQRVPLLIRAPGGSPARVAEPVGLVDLAPTVLDLVGLEPRAEMRGMSLRPVLAGTALPRRDLYFESHSGSIVYGWAKLSGVRSGRWKLIDSRDPELFDLQADPAETTNLASLEPERVAELREELHRLQQPLESAAAQAESAETQIDPEALAALKTLGYVGGDTGESTVEHSPHPRSLIDIEPELLAAQTAVAMGDWPYLEDLCRYTLERDPFNKWALVQMSLALLQLNRLEEAMEHARAARAAYPDSELGYKALADVHMAQKEPDQAYAILQEGLARKPDSGPLKLFSLLASFEAGRESTCREVAAAVAQHPRVAALTVLTARCEARGGEPEKALDTLRKAVDLGFKDLKRLKEAEDFRAVTRLPGFEELQASAATRSRSETPQR